MHVYGLQTLCVHYKQSYGNHVVPIFMYAYHCA